MALGGESDYTLTLGLPKTLGPPRKRLLQDTPEVIDEIMRRAAGATAREGEFM